MAVKNSSKRIVWIIDDNKYLCKQIAGILKKSPHIKKVLMFYSCESVLNSLPKSTEQPAIILLDIYFSGSTMTGIDAMPLLKQQYPQTKIIILTSCEEEINARILLQKGAAGFLIKNVSPDYIVKSVESSLLGVATIDSSVLLKMVSRVPVKQIKYSNVNITPRENDILTDLTKGLSMKMIADNRGIGYTTVNSHLKKLHQKLGVHNRSELVCKAIKEKLVL